MITFGMVHWLTLLSIVKIMAQAHNACKGGKLVYERIPGHRLDSGLEEHTYEEITDPSIVVSTCTELCRNDRLDTGDVNPCKAFNFKTLSSKTRLMDAEELWRPSMCFFAKPNIQESAKKTESLTKDFLYDHFVEICVNETDILLQNCPNKTHIFTRFPGIMFSPGNEKKVRGINSREECENSCLRETEFTCRSANYEASTQTCSLSALTIRMKSAQKTVKRNERFEYLENNCLKGGNRCEGIASFIKEEHKEMPRNKDLLSLHNIEEKECRKICRDDKGELPFLCHSFHYNPVEQLCFLSEDYFSEENNGIVTSNALSYHEVVCIQGGDNPDWDPRAATEKRLSLTPDDPEVPLNRSDQSFELFRNYNIDTEFYGRFSEYDLGRCLDECLHSEEELKCKALIYNPKTLECRMSRRNKYGTRLFFDDSFNYYENIKYSKSSRQKNVMWPNGSESRHHILGQFPNRKEDGSYYSNYGGAYQPSTAESGHGGGGWNQENDGSHHNSWDRDPSWNHNQGFAGHNGNNHDSHYPSGSGGNPGWNIGTSNSWNAGHHGNNNNIWRPGSGNGNFNPNNPGSRPGDPSWSNDGKGNGHDRPHDSSHHFEDHHHYPGGGGHSNPSGGFHPGISSTSNTKGGIPSLSNEPGWGNKGDGSSSYPFQDGSNTGHHEGSRPNESGWVKGGHSSGGSSGYPFQDGSHHGGGSRPGGDDESGWFNGNKGGHSSGASGRPFQGGSSGQGGRPNDESGWTNGNKGGHSSNEHHHFQEGSSGQGGRPNDESGWSNGNKGGHSSSGHHHFQDGSNGQGGRPNDESGWSNGGHVSSGHHGESSGASGGSKFNNNGIGSNNGNSKNPTYPPHRGSKGTLNNQGGFIPGSSNHEGSKGSHGFQHGSLRPSHGNHPHGGSEGYDASSSSSGHGFHTGHHGSSGGSQDGSSGLSLGNTVRRPRCEPGQDRFKQMRSRSRLQSRHIKRKESVNSLSECEEICAKMTAFKCKSFNFVSGFSPTSTQNCELSDFSLETTDLNNPKYFTISEPHDFYMRDSRSDDCLDVSQTCTESEMVFTLRTPKSFRGRIYTYRHYDKDQCFISGTGSNVHVLRISGASAYPNCGTVKYGNTQTNIVIVQHSELVQTSRDVIYNLTCTVQNPGEAIVSSGYIGSTYIGSGSLGDGSGEGGQGSISIGGGGSGGSGGHGGGGGSGGGGGIGIGGFGKPIPIEYLPAEHTLDSRVRLVISYQGRPTTTIAVGDPLEFKIETQDGENLIRDIFATNVIAKDPYSQRAIRLIDNRGCPVDSEVFPALGLSQTGDGLKTYFNAFKIPESNFLVFEANIRTCRGGCPPVDCQGPRGRELSYGKRRRRRRSTEEDSSNGTTLASSSEGNDIGIKEMFKVFDTREEIQLDEVPSTKAPNFPLRSESDCPTEPQKESTALIVSLVILALLVIGGAIYIIHLLRSRRHHEVSDLISEPDTRNPGIEHFEAKRSYFDARRDKKNNLRFQDPSEPIYTDPTLFEKSSKKYSRKSMSLD